jgi:hypothetical protein
MNWQETVMTYEQGEAIDNEVEKQYKKSKEYKGMDWAYTDEDRRTPAYKKVLRRIEAQAKATWEARQPEVDEAEQRGIRKMVEWIKNQRVLKSKDKSMIVIEFRTEEWQAFLKR